MNNLAKRVAGLHIQAKSYARIVYSPRPFSSFRSVRQQNGRKPNGLWYECDKEWKQHIQAYFRSQVHEYKHKYLLEVNLNRMCVIRTEKGLLDFHSKYGVEMSWGTGIKWEDVAKDYDGIEICPYQPNQKNLDWYYTWDVASGCLWGSSAFKSIHEVDNDISDEEYFVEYPWE